MSPDLPVSGTGRGRRSWTRALRRPRWNVRRASESTAPAAGGCRATGEVSAHRLVNVTQHDADEQREVVDDAVVRESVVRRVVAIDVRSVELLRRAFGSWEPSAIWQSRGLSIRRSPRRERTHDHTPGLVARRSRRGSATSSSQNDRAFMRVTSLRSKPVPREWLMARRARRTRLAGTAPGTCT